MSYYFQVWLAEHTCRQLLEHVLCTHLEHPDVLINAESVKLFCMKHEDTVTGSGKKIRVDKEMANATACLDYKVSFVTESFSTQKFTFKVVSLPKEPQAKPVINPLTIIMQSRTTFLSLPPRLVHQRMYANHELHNELLGFLEQHNLGWHITDANTMGKNFVDNMSKALFQCNPAVWQALADKHNSGAMLLSLYCTCPVAYGMRFICPPFFFF